MCAKLEQMALLSKGLTAILVRFVVLKRVSLLFKPEGVSDLIDEEAEEDDEVDSEDDEDEDEDEDEEDGDDEIEPGQVKSTVVAGEDDSDEDNDEPPTEELIAKKDSKSDKKAGKKEGIPRIPAGPPPLTTPKNQIIFVNNFGNGEQLIKN